MPYQALPTGLVTTRATPSIGLNTTPNAERRDEVIELPCKSNVNKITDVSASKTIARRRLMNSPATIFRVDLLENGLRCQTLHCFDVVKRESGPEHY